MRSMDTKWKMLDDVRILMKEHVHELNVWCIIWSWSLLYVLVRNTHCLAQSTSGLLPHLDPRFGPPPRNSDHQNFWWFFFGPGDPYNIYNPSLPFIYHCSRDTMQTYQWPTLCAGDSPLSEGGIEKPLLLRKMRKNQRKSKSLHESQPVVCRFYTCLEVGN